jgi:hypothetical protein
VTFHHQPIRNIRHDGGCLRRGSGGPFGPMTEPDDRTRIVIDAVRSSPPSGTIAVGAAPEAAFQGWVELLGVLSRVLAQPDVVQDENS